MRLSVTRNLHEYWDGLRGERAAPDRAEIDPVAIRHLLPDTFIIEVDVAQRFPLRLCGARVNTLWRCDQKGRPFLGWWRSAREREVAEAIRQVIDDETPLVARARAGASDWRAAEFELLLLPLRHFGKSRSRVLGSLAPAQGLDCPVGLLDLVAARALHESATEAKAGWLRSSAGRLAAFN
jgi:hypothetical protein